MTDDELRGLLETLRTDLRADIHSVRTDLRAEMATAHAETRRHIDVVNEATRHEIRILAEGIAFVREDLRRTEARLDEKIDASTAETQALIRYSHTQLDQRLQALER